MALFSSAKHAVILTLHGPVRYFHVNGNDRDGNYEVRVPMVPPVPRVPRIPLQRD